MGEEYCSYERGFAFMIAKLWGLETYKLNRGTGNDVVKRDLVASAKRACRPFPSVMLLADPSLQGCWRSRPAPNISPSYPFP